MELRGPDDKIKEVRETDNLVVDVGREYIRDVWLAHDDAGATTAAARMKAFKLGDTATAPATGDTALHNYLSGSNLLLTVPGTGIIASGADSILYQGTWPSGPATALVNVQEVGIFNNSTDAATPVGQIMLARAVVAPAINKADGDTITIQWTITVA